MPNSKDVFSQVVSEISIDEEQDEIKSIAYLLLLEKFGITKTEIISGQNVDHLDKNKLDKYLNRINQSEPIQYIVGKQDFYGRSFEVNPSVLIPRPETEQLVREVISLCKREKIDQPSILDIGTGSGCIPITLSLELPSVQSCGIDISTDALNTARKNAFLHDVDVEFLQCDVLKNSLPVGNFNLIVSNPPYISYSEKVSIKPNVLNYEPHEALFVPNEDPLLFYREIINKCLESTVRAQWIVFEINETYGHEVAALLSEKRFSQIEILKDLSQKDRIAIAHFCE